MAVERLLSFSLASSLCRLAFAIENSRIHERGWKITTVLLLLHASALLNLTFFWLACLIDVDLLHVICVSSMMDLIPFWQAASEGFLHGGWNYLDTYIFGFERDSKIRNMKIGPVEAWIGLACWTSCAFPILCAARRHPCCNFCYPAVKRLLRKLRLGRQISTAAFFTFDICRRVGESCLALHNFTAIRC